MSSSNNNNRDTDVTSSSSNETSFQAPAAARTVGSSEAMPQSSASKLKQAIPSKRVGSSHLMEIKRIMGDDCDRPACDDVTNKLQQLLMTSSQGSTSPPTSNKPANDEHQQSMPCPPRSGEIGHSSWNLLHSMVRRNIVRVHNYWHTFLIK